MCYTDLGRAYLTSDRLADALRSYRRAEAITRSIVAADPSDAQARWLHGLELNSIGFALTHMHREPEAVASHTKALALLERARAGRTAERDVPVQRREHAAADRRRLRLRPPPSSRRRPSRRGATRAPGIARAPACSTPCGSSGTLTASFAADAEHVAARLARCEADLAARGERPLHRRAMHPGARRCSSVAYCRILPPRAWIAGRFARLGATQDFHHGLPADRVPAHTFQPPPLAPPES